MNTLFTIIMMAVFLVINNVFDDPKPDFITTAILMYCIRISFVVEDIAKEVNNT